jgi:hypothetical protein
MGSARLINETFYCHLCERRLKRTMLSRLKLKNSARMDQRICRQCETFLQEGLGFLAEKIAEKKWTLVSPGDSDLPISLLVSVPPDMPVESKTAPKRTSKPPRAASAIEKEAFHFHSLSVERHIEGFIKGLESAGMDRSRLSQNAVAAVNNLLHIAQTLAGQRLEVQSARHLSRADVRRMSRHVDETALLVKEYIAAVSEACLDN